MLPRKWSNRSTQRRLLGAVTGAATLEKTGLPCEDKDMHIPVSPAHFLGTCCRDSVANAGKETCIRVSLAALFITARNWKETKCQLPEE